MQRRIDSSMLCAAYDVSDTRVSPSAISRFTRCTYSVMTVVRSVARALAVLEAVAQCEGDASLQWVAERAGLDKATAMRMLRTLCSAGYVEQDAQTRRFSVTQKIARLAEGQSGQGNLREALHPYLVEVRDATGETVHLGVMSADKVVYIDKLESSRSIRLVSAIGQEMPLHCTALGKAMLAHLPGVEQDAVLSRITLQRRTRRTITEPAQLRRELATTLRRGWAVDKEENEESATCVAVPVITPDGTVLGAISISGPTFRVAPRTKELAAAIQKALAKMRRRGGWDAATARRA